MNAAEISLFVFGLYIGITGFLFILIPNTTLKMMKMPSGDLAWVRILGAVMLGLTFYYLYIAILGISGFIPATVYGRFGVAVLFWILALTKKAPPHLFLFGFVDSGGALWTLLVM